MVYQGIKRVVAIAALVLLTGCTSGSSGPPPLLLQRNQSDIGRDDTISATVRQKLAQADAQDFRSITVETWGGRVLLMGAVTKPELRRRAGRIAGSVSGTSQVLNELLLTEESHLGQFAENTAQEQRVRRELGLTTPTGTTVRVVGETVFLLGAASSPRDVEQLKADAGDIDGIKWVVGHVRTPQVVASKQDASR